MLIWWAQQDSNLRLPPCEGGTLPLSYAPFGNGRTMLRLTPSLQAAKPLLPLIYPHCPDADSSQCFRAAATIIERKQWRIWNHFRPAIGLPLDLNRPGRTTTKQKKP